MRSEGHGPGIRAAAVAPEWAQLAISAGQVSTNHSRTFAPGWLLGHILSCLGFMPRCRSSPASSSTSPTSPRETTRSSSTEEARFSSLFTKSRNPIFAAKSVPTVCLENVDPATDPVESWLCRLRSKLSGSAGQQRRGRSGRISPGAINSPAKSDVGA